MTRSRQHDIFQGLATLHHRRLVAAPTACDLRLSELSIFSQNGEDGVIEALIRVLEVEPPFFVEFGVGDGSECNTRLLTDVFGWSGLYIEPDAEAFARLDRRHRHLSRIECVNDAVTPANVDDLFGRYSVPERFGLLSIDIDGQDYWVWQALGDRYRPAIVVIECNTAYDRDQAVVEAPGLPYPTHFVATFGASVAAVERLGAAKGYRLVHVEQTGVNAFLVRDDLLGGDAARLVGLTERSPNYHFSGEGHRGVDSRPTVELDGTAPWTVDGADREEPE